VLRIEPGNEDALVLLAAAESAERSPTGASENAATGAATQIATPNSVPTSFASGRYRVRRFLGEGGKKRAFFATTRFSTATSPSP
jgi:hypothetical protein